ncbi:hypothetical protein SDC9_105294 [bioreactor metagenome]|uniref:Uncharacterized protein n=1 Tax=bioreactor metagenome TaxID=1076179 RepID=A0A645B5P7_9ZZZZ
MADGVLLFQGDGRKALPAEAVKSGKLHLIRQDIKALIRQRLFHKAQYRQHLGMHRGYLQGSPHRPDRVQRKPVDKGLGILFKPHFARKGTSGEILKESKLLTDKVGRVAVHVQGLIAVRLVKCDDFECHLVEQNIHSGYAGRGPQRDIDVGVGALKEPVILELGEGGLHSCKAAAVFP